MSKTVKEFGKKISKKRKLGRNERLDEMGEGNFLKREIYRI